MKFKFILSLLLSAIFLWWALNGLHFDQIAQAFSGVRWLPVSLMVIPMIMTHFFRARRWRLFLKPFRDIGLWELFRMNMVGFMSISLFPLRLGEVTRPLLLKKRHQIAFATGVATIALERIFDALVTALILIIGLMAAPFSHSEFPGSHVSLRTMIYTAAIVVLLGFLFLFLAVVFRKWAHEIVVACVRRLPQALHEKGEKFSENFFAGMNSLPNARSFARLFFESVCVWGSVVLGYACVLEGFGLKPHWSAYFSIVGFSAAGVSIPAAPGAVGTLHAALAAALILYGVDKATSLAFAIVAHAINFLFTVLAGLVFLPSMSMGFGKLYDEASHQT